MTKKGFVSDQAQKRTSALSSFAGGFIKRGVYKLLSIYSTSESNKVFRLEKRFAPSVL